MLLLFASKALIAPVLLALAAIVEHRWGGVAGGWLLGLPLTSGPMSFFLLTEHGPRYAENAARGALLGLVGAGVFCAGYYLAAQKRSWRRSLALAGIACLSVTFALSLVQLDLGATVAFAIVVLGLVAVVAAVPKRVPAAPTTAPTTTPATTTRTTRRNLIFRMVAASAVVVGISAASTVLGSAASGMLAAAPAITAVMAVSTHRAAGKDSVRGLLRGSVAGMWGGAAFFAVVGLLVTIAAPGVTYLAAIAAAVLVSTIIGRAATSQRLSTAFSAVRAA